MSVPDVRVIDSSKTVPPPASLRGCLKSPEMSILTNAELLQGVVSTTLSPLKSIMPIFTWIPFHAATETFQTASQGSTLQAEPLAMWSKTLPLLSQVLG